MYVYAGPFSSFDTIDHNLLLRRLEHSFGVTSKALEWLCSYLQDRTQCVAIGDSKSSSKELQYGVPQGSVLGPKAYCIYTKPVTAIIRDHGFNYHCYADDSQSYITISPSASWDTTAYQIQACITDVKRWMSSNLLKLNQDKTEVIIFHPKHVLNVFADQKLTIENSIITPARQIRNLGVIQDHHLSMEAQVNAICKIGYYHLRNIGAVRKYITSDACKILVHASIISRLDYANVVLYGLPSKLTQCLQRLQNSAARIISKTPRRDHISPVLAELHWLPVEYRIKYKVLSFTYKAIAGCAPSYVSELVEQCKPSRCLRSSEKLMLCVPKARTVTYGDRSFRRSAATLWNELPEDIRNADTLSLFHRKLKTFLFRKAFQM